MIVVRCPQKVRGIRRRHDPRASSDSCQGCTYPIRQFRLFLGGIAPYGFRVEDGELVKDPGQQATIKRMVQLRRKGMSLWKIADAMNAAGVQISHMGIRAALERASVTKPAREATR